VRLDPLQADVERLYAEKVRGGWRPTSCVGTAEALADLGLADARVGFDDLRLARHVERELPGLRTEDALDAWLDIRKVKTPLEIEFLRRGAAINEAGLRDILPAIRPGVAGATSPPASATTCRPRAPPCCPPRRPCSSAPSTAASTSPT
jgi:Xaa-Pro aminopeptidase